MPLTPKLGLVYPNDQNRNYYATFVALVNALDLGIYSRVEDANLIFSGGGTFSWNAGTGVLSWSSTIDILSPVVGKNWTVAAGSATLADGQVAFVTLSRAPSVNTSVTIEVADNLSSVHYNLGLLLFHRRGTVLYCRTGRTMESGDAFPLLTQSSDAAGVGTTGQVIRTELTLATNETTDSSTYKVIGAFSFNSAIYALEGTTTVIRFKSVGSVNDAALTQDVVLYNLTTASIVTTLSSTGDLTPTEELSSALTLGATPTVYEVRHRVTGGTPPDDVATCWWAGLEITQTIA